MRRNCKEPGIVINRNVTTKGLVFRGRTFSEQDADLIYAPLHISQGQELTDGSPGLLATGSRRLGSLFRVVRFGFWRQIATMQQQQKSKSRQH